MAEERWPVDVGAFEHGVAASMLWTLGGQPMVTVVVKSAFTVVPGGTMTPASLPKIAASDQHLGHDPKHSLTVAGDLVPYRPAVDVWLTGHAYAPGGAPATASVAAFSMSRATARGSAVVLAKRLDVRGTRGPDGAPKPFHFMPLVYERAANTAENPVGVPGRPPNFVRGDGGASAGFGPIPRTWPARRSLLGQLDPSLVDGPRPALPSGIDWRYFHAAPADQRLARLDGAETIILEGLHPRLPRAESRLPGATAHAWLYGPGAYSTGKAVALLADTLCIDVDRQICCVVWRGNAKIDHALAEKMRVVASVSLPARPRAAAPAWPPAPSASPRPSSTPPARAGGGVLTTVAMSPAEAAIARSQSATPFARASAPAAPAAPTISHVGEAAGRAATADDDAPAQTIDFARAGAPRFARATPFEGPAEPAPLAVALPPPAGHEEEPTLTLFSDDVAPSPLPFVAGIAPSAVAIALPRAAASPRAMEVEDDPADEAPLTAPVPIRQTPPPLPFAGASPAMPRMPAPPAIESYPPPPFDAPPVAPGRPARPPARAKPGAAPPARGKAGSKKTKKTRRPKGLGREFLAAVEELAPRKR